MKWNLLAVMLMLWLGQAFAQTEPLDYKNQLGLQLGYNEGVLEDLNFSPLHYKDSGKIYGLTFDKESGQSLFSFEGAYSSGTAKTSLGLDSLATDYIQGDVKLRYMRRTRRLQTTKAKVFVGGQYHFHINYLDWDDLSAFSFLVNHSFDIASQVNVQLNDKSHLSLSLALAVFGLVVQPPYNGLDQELIDTNYEGKILKLITNGNWGSFDKMLSYDFKLFYQYQISNKWDLSATYLNRYQRVTNIHKYTHFQNQFSLGINLKF